MGFLEHGESSDKHNGHLGGWAELERTGVRGRDNFVKMHILHDKLGGKAVDSNLTPAKSSINSDFYRSMEKPALKASGLLNGDRRNPAANEKWQTIWYSVKIDYHGGDALSQQFPKSVHADWGYHLASKNWEKGKRVKSWSAFPEVPDWATKRYIINEDGKGALGNMEYNGTKFSKEFVNLLVEERNKPFAPKDKTRKNYLTPNELESRLSHRVSESGLGSKFILETEFLLDTLMDSQSSIKLDGKAM